MALKGDRLTLVWELAYYLNATASQGSVVNLATASSGADLDGSTNEVELAASPSGKVPIGILMDDFVDIDLTRYELNAHKPESNVGSKASILRKGWVVTDKITGSPAAGDRAVMAGSGVLQKAPTGWNITHTNTPYVGWFETSKDEDGFARVFVDL